MKTLHAYRTNKDAVIAELCEHLKAFRAYCIENKISIGACGDCGSAWVDCEPCEIEVEMWQELDEEP